MPHSIKSKHNVTVSAPQVRTPEAMKRDAQKQAPAFPSGGDLERKGHATFLPRALSAPARPGGVKPFLPTMDFDKYAQKKGTIQAAQAMQSERGPTARAVEGRPHSPVGLTGPDIDGASTQGLVPPDTHGAVGAQEYVETTNSQIDIYDKANPANHTSMSQAAFFGYFTQTLFDARVIYDSAWNRWVVIADAFPESDTVQYQLIAVSMTASANGAFWIYALNVAFGAGDFWDYPQLGMDQDSIIFTANIFHGNTYLGADLFAVAKARLYNGWGFSVPVFQRLSGTLAPPIVLDQNANTFLIAAPDSGAPLKLYTLTNSSRPNATALSGPIDVTVDAYDIPPAASQPGTADVLDTLDGRFVNASTQTGDFLWQVHTINLANFPTPKFYQINTATNTVVQNGFFYASGTSNDFNASIAANGDNDVFVTWSSTDPAANIHAQVRFAGWDHSDGPVAFGAGGVLFTSGTFLTDGRWGDYSAVSIDPANSRQAWFVNEKINDTTHWGSRIGSMQFA